MSRKEILKTYHGIPKSVTDEHTVFYASFDGSTESNIGNVINAPISNNAITGYYNMPQGVGAKITNSTTKYKLDNIDTGIITIDFTIYPYGDILTKTTAIKILLSLVDSSNNTIYSIARSNSTNGWAGDIKSTGKYYNVYNGVAFSSAKVTFVRVVIDTFNNEMRFYENGNLCVVNGDTQTNKPTLTTTDVFKSISYIVIGSASTAGYVISDLHISNIDRGDYFPNLPQDFIDGKAIIKPRMGQQQIKGDPMYSQVSIVKATHTLNSVKDVHWGKQNSDGFVTSLITPELSTNNTNFEEATGKIKIKGLNGEIISGVIDTDTALCRVLSAKSTNVLIVDNVSSLQNGDKIRSYNYKTGTTGSEFSISNIDVDNKVVTISNSSGTSWTNGSISDGYCHMIETTGSSSSPIVKASDGTTVSGTWTGLGTTEAVFTLGTNSSIAGKDLYIEYALNMPYGNSDFPELPYSVYKAWGENGVEMKPVSEILITDDFKGKTSGSDKECSYKGYRCYSNILQPPSNINPVPNNGFTEFSTADYEILSKLDNRKIGPDTIVEGKMPQLLFSFNLIDIIERKLGVEIIDSSDKISWLKNNISKVVCRYNAYGSSGKYYTRFFKNNNWAGTSSVSGTSITPYSDTLKVDLPGSIQSDGTLHFLVYTDASDGSTKSSINIDYISIEVYLSSDTSYTSLYCDNTRAREDKCNPVLIQKETKTVKRYLPSKECFSTECKYYKKVYLDKPYITGTPLPNNFLSESKVEITTYGTGSYVQPINIGFISGDKKYYNNCINNVVSSYLKTYKYTNEPLNTHSNRYSKSSTINRRMKFNGSFGIYDNFFRATLTDDITMIAKNYCALLYFMYKYNNEVVMAIIATEYINDKWDNEIYLLCNLPNRPLIK